MTTLSTQFATSAAHVYGAKSIDIVQALPSRHPALDGNLYLLVSADLTTSFYIYDRNAGTDGNGAFVRLPSNPKVTNVHLVKDQNTLHGTASGGTFDLTWKDQNGKTGKAAGVAWNTSAAALVTALGTAGLVVTATGGVLGTTDIVVTTTTYIGPITFTIDNTNATGGVVSNTHTTPGVNVTGNDIQDNDLNIDKSASNAVTIATSGIFA